MALINSETKELHCKIVYYGPALGGKTTNMRWVYKNTHAEQDPSKLVEMDMGDPERTQIFDFLPFSIGEVRGLKVRLHLYAVPGQVVFDQIRRFIITDLDGVIFVADSQYDRMDENIHSLENLEKNLALSNKDIKNIPLVFQYNKRDLPNAASLAELRSALNKYNSPDFEAEAEKGVGVMESLETIAKTIVAVIKNGQV